MSEKRTRSRVKVPFTFASLAAYTVVEGKLFIVLLLERKEGRASFFCCWFCFALSLSPFLKIGSARNEEKRPTTHGSNEGGLGEKKTGRIKKAEASATNSRPIHLLRFLADFLPIAFVAYFREFCPPPSSRGLYGFVFSSEQLTGKGFW